MAKKISEIKLVGDLPDHIANNYELVDMDKLTANVSIAKRKVITKVIQKPENPNEIMEMVSDTEPVEIERPFTEISKTDDLVVAYLQAKENTGFVDNKVPDDLIVPEVKVSGEAENQSPNQTYTAYYVPDFPTEGEMKNYEFYTNVKEYIGANLRITAALVDKKVLSLGGVSKNVYQSEPGETIYYKDAESSGIRFTIDNTNTNAEYKRIFYKTIENGIEEWIELKD